MTGQSATVMRIGTGIAMVTITTTMGKKAGGVSGCANASHGRTMTSQLRNNTRNIRATMATTVSTTDGPTN